MQAAENSAPSVFCEKSGIAGHILRFLLSGGLFACLLTGVDSATIETISASGVLLLAAAVGLCIAFAAAGTGVAILGGGLDLSAGGVVSLSLASATYAAHACPGSNGAVIAAILLTGAVCGALNGWLAGAVRLHAGFTTFVTGLCFLQLGGLVPGDRSLVAQTYWKAEGTGELLLLCGAALAGLLLLAVAIKFTVWGRNLRATGSSLQVARECGIRTVPLRFSAYLLSGLLAASFAFPVLLLYLWPLPGVLTNGLLFPAVAIIGGCIIGGGRGGILGITLAGLIAGAGFYCSLRTGSAQTALLTLSLGALALLVCLLSGSRKS